MPKTKRTWTLSDRGYDCDQFGQQYDCTAKTLIEAIQMLDGFANAAHIRVRGYGSTYDVYSRAPSESGADWSKIGCVTVHNP